MNKRRVGAVMVCGFLLVVASLGGWALVEWAPPSRAAATQLVAAAGQFSMDAVHRGRGSSTSIQVGDLVSGGYITARAGRKFRGADISLTGEDGSTHPDAGRSFVLLGDGSIHER